MQTTLYLEDGELAKLIRMSTRENRVATSFGPGWVGIKYDDEQPLPWAVEAVLSWRGVLSENTAGAGI